MSFRLVPKSVTLNYLERRNGGCHALFHRSFPGALRRSACLQIHRHFLWQNIIVAIFAKVRPTENKCIMHRRSHVSDFRHYNITESLLLANFNFNYKSDFPMMKM